MPYTTLISITELAEHLNDPDWAIIDCRFSLADPERGRRDYFSAHIPGGLYAHLDEDLCSPVIKGVTGRHPLPSITGITQTLSNWGIDSDVQVIAYDESGGAMAAARLWWILHWLGHESKAVLDSGWQAWLNKEKPIHSGIERRTPRNFIPQMKPNLFVDSAIILERISEPDAKCDRFLVLHETGIVVRTKPSTRLLDISLAQFLLPIQITWTQKVDSCLARRYVPGSNPCLALRQLKMQFSTVVQASPQLTTFWP